MLEAALEDVLQPSANEAAREFAIRLAEEANCM